MRKIISSLLVFAMLFTSCVMCFAGSAEVEQERCSVEVSLGQKDEVAAQVCENQKEEYVAQDLELNCENEIGLRPSGIITEGIVGAIGALGVIIVALVAFMVMDSQIGFLGLMSMFS